MLREQNPSCVAAFTPRVAQNFVLQKVSTNVVLKELSQLKVTKASGPDGITARLLKDAAPVIAKPITYLVNLIISTGLIPSEWKDARITPIFESGARNEVNNYRPISPDAKDYEYENKCYLISA